mgnify:CR=1 FL=1
MENAVDALKIAAGVLMFVLALTISISCFSQANESITTIVNMKDKDTNILYDNIKPSNSLTRIVGVETIIPTLYKTYDENIEVYFKDASGEAMKVYYKIDANGEREQNDNQEDITIDYINLADETYPDKETRVKHLDMILGGRYYMDEDFKKKYSKQIFYPEGFFNIIKEKKFEEQLGEYYESNSYDKSNGSNESNNGSTSTQIKKRRITYQLVQ